MMKPIQNFISKIAAMIMVMFFSLSAIAQEGGSGTDIKVDINKESGNWYSQPWVWIVGVAVFILLLVALLRGNSRSAE
jgi:hypothetical protein